MLISASWNENWGVLFIEMWFFPPFWRQRNFPKFVFITSLTERGRLRRLPTSPKLLVFEMFQCFFRGRDVVGMVKWDGEVRICFPSRCSPWNDKGFRCNDVDQHFAKSWFSVVSSGSKYIEQHWKHKEIRNGKEILKVFLWDNRQMYNQVNRISCLETEPWKGRSSHKDVRFDVDNHHLQWSFSNFPGVIY